MVIKLTFQLSNFIKDIYAMEVKKIQGTYCR